MNKLRNVWQKLVPDKLQGYIRFVLESKSLTDRRLSVLAHFKTIDPQLLSPEIVEGLKYLRSHKYSAMPYYWTLKYDNLFPEVFYDENNNCYYVIFDGKRMYFPARLTEKQVIWIVRGIYKEQDPQSPHLYLAPEFQIDPDSIVVDAGVAEGNFALSIVEKSKLLYLVECDPEWMAALKLTFAPWKEKVIFVEKFMSDTESASTTSIDSLLNPESKETYFIKMDIEGFEQKALAGMKNLVASGSKIKMDVCTYHHINDLQEIESIIKDYGFEWHVTKSYMLYFQTGEDPSFRKVLIRAEKT